MVREYGGTPEAEPKVRAIMDEAMSEVTRGQRDIMGVSDSQIDGQVKMMLSKWFRELLVTDPRPTLEQVKVPVLAINGKKDVQVAWEKNLDSIEASLTKGGNRQVKVIAYDDLNHLFQKSKTGAIAEYGPIGETINEQVLNDVSNWVRKTTGLE